MLSVQGILDLINDSGYKKPLLIEQWKDVYYRMSLHIDGICPAYRDIRFGTLQSNSSNVTWGGNAYVNPNKLGWCSEYQWLFESYLFSRYPHEDDLVRTWRFSQYKPFTQSPFLQVIQVITGAIFQDSGYSITVNDKSDNDYIWGKNFHGKSLVNYISDNFQMICADPNGVFVVAPKESHYETTTSDIQPDIWFIPSRDIIWYGKDEIIFKIEDIYWAVNRMAYHRFQKVEDTYQNIDPSGYYYAHFLERVPAYKAGGLWNNRGYYESWLNSARAIADQYVISISDEQMVMKQASHPFIIEADTECPDCESHSGYIQNKCSCNGDGDATCDCSGTGYVRTMCPTCKGNGSISRNPADRIIAPTEDMDKDLIKIVNPDTAINKLHIERNKEIYNDMLRALHLHYIEQAQSGIAKDKDMETRYQFILKISNDLFDRLLTGLIEDILALRNVSVNGGIVMPRSTDYVIVKPTQFQIKTTYDLLEDLTKGKESGLPSYQLSQLQLDYVEKQFGGNDLLKKKTEVINIIDVLANLPTADIQAIVLNNAATNRDWQFSVRLSYILDKLIRTNGQEWFLNQSIDNIETAARTEFDKVMPPTFDATQPIVVDENRAFA